MESDLRSKYTPRVTSPSDMTFHALASPSMKAATPLNVLGKQSLDRSQSTPPRRRQLASVKESAGTRQEATKRYHARKEPLPTRHRSPRTRSSSSSIERTNNTKRRYATRSTVLSPPNNAGSGPRHRSPSMFKPPSKRDVLFTLRRRLSVESVPLNRIPSFMDHFLNYQSPSVDYDSEEILLDIAYRIKLHKLCHILGSEYGGDDLNPSDKRIQFLWPEQGVWKFAAADDRNYDGITTQTRHPDSFERSTSGWTDL